MDENMVDPAPVGPRRGGAVRKLILIVVPLVLLAAGGAWWFFAASGQKVEAADAKIEERGIVPLETFLVNLSDPGGNRFLKVSLRLVFASEAAANHVAENAALMGHARSAILELLTEQNAQTLVTAAGKQQLKEDVKAHVSKIFIQYKVIDVLFSEFVVQF